MMACQFAMLPFAVTAAPVICAVHCNHPNSSWMSSTIQNFTEPHLMLQLALKQGAPVMNVNWVFYQFAINTAGYDSCAL